MTEPTDKNYHLRNLAVPELALRALEWHGGMGTAVYSFGSTGMNNLVSPSMIDAAIDELDRDFHTNKTLPKGNRWTREEMDELMELINDLDEARASGEHEYDGEDDGYATWLMEENPRAGGKKNRSHTQNPLQKILRKLFPMSPKERAELDAQVQELKDREDAENRKAKERANKAKWKGPKAKQKYADEHARQLAAQEPYVPNPRKRAKTKTKAKAKRKKNPSKKSSARVISRYLKGL